MTGARTRSVLDDVEELGVPGAVLRTHTIPRPQRGGVPAMVGALWTRLIPQPGHRRRSAVVTWMTPTPQDDPADARPAMLASVTLRRHGGATVLVVTGEIDLFTVASLDRALRHTLRTRPALLVLDLSAVRYLSCAAVGVLRAALRPPAPSPLRVVAGQRAVLRAIQLSGPHPELVLYPSRLAALARSTSAVA
jgi:anti-sigma B factor antagonist